jgi:hypothetical protein
MQTHEESDYQSERVLRLFVSSPSDVKPERERVELVAARFNAELKGIAKLKVIRWEDSFYTADKSFQESIDSAVGRMADTDIVVCIVWKRVGLELNPKVWCRPDGKPFEGGTVYEFEMALQASRQHGGVPDVYLFRKGAPVLFEADKTREQERQYELLKAVWKRWTETEAGHNVAAYQTFEGPDDFEEKLEHWLKQWLERRGILASGLVWDRSLKNSPFRGLAAFDAAHAPVFFGREAEIARAVARLREAEQSGTPFLLVVGGSGSGKSSLLRAGLVPRLALPGAIRGVETWRRALVVPTNDPLQNLAESLFDQAALGDALIEGEFGTPQLLGELLASKPEIAVRPIAGALARVANRQADTLGLSEPRPARLLLALDQVERMFVEAPPQNVDAFARILRELVERKLAVVIATLRSDAFSTFQAVTDFTGLLNKGATFHLLPPPPVELEDMILRPVAACQPALTYENNSEGHSLAEVLIRDAQGGDALPLLQMTLQRLYEAEERRGDGTLRFVDYPGMGPAIAKVADEVFAGLDDSARGELAALITALVRDVTQDLQTGTNLPVVVPVVRERFEQGRASRTRLVDAFIDARLMTTEETDGSVRVRPVHDALLRTWPQAAQLIQQQLELIRVRNLLEPIADEWMRADVKTKDELLEKRPTVLAGAAELLRRFGGDVSANMRSFIEASRAAERGEFRRSLFSTGAGLVLHIVPPTAAITIFLLLATQTQLREIYLSYLEGLGDQVQIASNVTIFLAAGAGLALISSAIYVSHVWLGALRLGANYASLLHPNMEPMHRFGPVRWSLIPWCGLVAGLFNAKLYLVARYDQLRAANVDPETMNYLRTPGTFAIFISMVILALVVAVFLDRYRRSIIIRSMTVAAVPFGAMGLFLLLTDLPVGALSGSRFVGGLFILLVSAVWYLGYYRLYTMRTGWIYAQPTFPGIDVNRRQRIALFTWAVLPWLAIGLYFVIKAVARPHSSLPFAETLDELPVVSRWALIPVMMTWVIAAGLAVVMVLDYFRESTTLQRIIIGIVVALVIGAGIVSYGSVDTIVWLYRLLGPLTCTMLMLLFAVSAFILLAVLSQKSGFPALTIVVLAVIVNVIFPIPIDVMTGMLIVVCAIFMVMVLLSRLWSDAAMAMFLMLLVIVPWVRQGRSFSVEPHAGSAPDLRIKFMDWLGQRVDATAYSGRPYPVFIIAVEGGGIYAASAASLFLAKLEDANPGFSQHVFAISGVEGGAIGATVFQALMQSKSAPNKPPATPLVATVSRIMQDDHLSPLVGAIIPEFLGAAAIGRAEAVAGSFRYSVRQEDRAAGRALDERFANHWTEKSEAPALLLNSTWAETGFRVAFSPFALHGYDDSLYSFTDENMPGDQQVNLMDAAVVSARLPGMLPPYSITMKAGDRELPWNFVDGGYSDISGASTALTIYRALASVPGNAEVKLILLTSSNPQPDLTPNKVSISGTVFRDTLAPFTSLLKVRQMLGNQAVARVCEELKTRGDCTLEASNPESPLKLVELEVETYDLPIGWKLSHATFEMIRWMVGDRRLCRSDNAGLTNRRSDDTPEFNEHTVERNSCVLKWVADLLQTNRVRAQ